MRKQIALASALVMLSPALPGRALASSHPSDRSTHRGTPTSRSLDGQGNNLSQPQWGVAGTQYRRFAAPGFADGVGKMVGGPEARWISNRIFNDLGQNLFSENAVTQWGWAWGQFLDHDMGLRDETPGEPVPASFDTKDPLERFKSDSSNLGFHRTPAAPGTDVGTVARQEINTLSSYIDGSAVYGTTTQRSSWLRSGAHLLLPNGFLPAAGARGNVATSPVMDLFGPQTGRPETAVVAGDVRANENVALTAVQTLFAREHNRIVDALPAALTDEQKFQIARRVVGAEIERITYQEFLPAMGVHLPAYAGYDETVNPNLTTEFATVGFRGHSMVHGEFEPTVPDGTFIAAQLAAFTRQGIKIEHRAGTVTLVIPLSVAFGNPGLLRSVGIGTLLGSLQQHEYKNDEQIDDTLRSVLFQVPKSAAACAGGTVDPNCFTLVLDLAAADILRQRDHGIPSYNALRSAYGLPAVRTFTEITGESTDALPTSTTINDPRIMRFTTLFDSCGKPVVLGSGAAADEAVVGVRASTTAARLKAAYKTVDAVDAFVGMSAERHLPGSELGPLQTAIWRQQFTALRDGDRYFYRADPVLRHIQQTYGVTARHRLSEIITLNTGHDAPADVFHSAES